MPTVRLALAQTNPVVGAFDANARVIIDYCRRARDARADVVVFGEMALSGYPIEDLATRPDFLEASRHTLENVSQRLADEGLGNLPVIIGYPDGPVVSARSDASLGAPSPIALNCAAVLHGGAIVARYEKHHLPTYSVFDECRTFVPGNRLLVVNVGGVDFALIICEDLWHGGDPIAQIRATNASVLLVLNASPFERDKGDVRLPLVTRRAQETMTTVAYVNIVGGQDDLVFDGESFIVHHDGTLVARAEQFIEELLVADIAVSPRDNATPSSQMLDNIDHVRLPQHEDVDRAPLVNRIGRHLETSEQVWNALVLGLRDYLGKNGFQTTLVGLSGGIDSALCAVLAADAIGSHRVHGVSMPSRFSSDHSRSDAKDLADRLNLSFRIQPIDEFFSVLHTHLGVSGVAAENLQARIRGIVLMAISNSEGHLVLSTGNKSELAVGYSTIYGDSVGGFAPIRDVPKSLVWELARWRNNRGEERDGFAPIPAHSITKPPSAELRPGQRDLDSLPDYVVLDAILDAYISHRKSKSAMIARGFDASTVDDTIRLVDESEWKRRQGPIGPRISALAFGRDRRLPITYHSS